MAWYRRDFEFVDYVSVAERRARARREADKQARRRGRALAPVGPLESSNRGKLVRTFWGRAWCENLESYSDYASRLPRGRSYLRHGAVIDLQIASGKVSALVSGSSIYETTIAIRSLAPQRWKEIAAACMGKIDSLIELLKGNLSEQVMEIVTRRERGLFPAPAQISLKCSCPDWAEMCKHVAAVLYGVGVRLDEQPDLLFTLRGVDHSDLIRGAAEDGVRLGTQAAGSGKGHKARKVHKVIDSPDLASLFGIEIETQSSGTPKPGEAPSRPVSARARGRAAAPAKKPVSPRRRSARSP